MGIIEWLWGFNELLYIEVFTQWLAQSRHSTNVGFFAFSFSFKCLQTWGMMALSCQVMSFSLPKPAIMYSFPVVFFFFNRFFEIYFTYHKIHLFLKCTILWLLVYSQKCATIIIIQFLEHFQHPRGNPIPIGRHFP